MYTSLDPKAVQDTFDHRGELPESEQDVQYVGQRRFNLIKRVDKLARLYYVDVVFITRRKKRYYTYRSTDH